MDVPNSKGKTIKDYFPQAIQKLMGSKEPATVSEQSSVAPAEQKQVIDSKTVAKIAETLKK